MTAENHVFPDFDPAWSAEQAGEVGGDGPLSPLARWAAWQMLIEYSARYEAGDRQVLFAALRLCACHDLPMPDWLAGSYCKSHSEWLSFNKPTLDEAFGVELPKGVHINRLKKQREYSSTIFSLVRAQQKLKRPTDKGLFEEIGLQLGLSPSDAEKIYYRSKLYKTFQSLKNR